MKLKKIKRIRTEVEISVNKKKTLKFLWLVQISKKRERKEETKDKPPHHRSHTSPQQEKDAVMIPMTW
jgi:ribosomal protein L30/L7E